MSWRAFYADGARYSSADTEWQSLPATGLVGVVVYMEPPYRRIIDGHDWVWMEAGEFRVVDSTTWGEWADEPVVACAACLKRGEGMEDVAWAAVQAEMLTAVEAP